eukprot:SM000043S15791  [mRNA]  locus=s43:141023:148693:- [translate_table: standard]
MWCVTLSHRDPERAAPDTAQGAHALTGDDLSVDHFLRRHSGLGSDPSRPPTALQPHWYMKVREFLQESCRVLVVGAGGLGCELLKDLALSGFGSIDVIDMDTIDVSNLNRQFLFRMQDVGKAKAEVAAERVMQRVSSVNVTPHFCRIEDKDPEFYRAFQIIVLGLDSLEARGWINSVVCSFLDLKSAQPPLSLCQCLTQFRHSAHSPASAASAPRPEYSNEGELDLASVTPMVDGGTEGFRGHARVILPGITPCFHCTLWLFPPQVTYPLCTLAETPRSPAHCIEYAHLILWGQERADTQFEADDPEHMKWVYDKALRRAELFGITGVTYSLTQATAPPHPYWLLVVQAFGTLGVVKNIIPAIASSNAIIAATCALETLKTATMCSAGMDNYMMYVGSQGVYTHTVSYEKDAACIICSPSIPLHVPLSLTLQELIQKLVSLPRFSGMLAQPSVSHRGTNLYMQQPQVLEQMTRENLGRPLVELMGGQGGILNVNDKKLMGVLRFQISFDT